MNIKKLLESHKEIDDRINLDLEEIAQLRSLAGLSSHSRSLFDESRPKGVVSDRVGSYAAKIADLEIRIDREIDRLVEVKERILDTVASLGNETEKAVLERHYILHEPWEVVAEKLSFSTRHIHRLHKQAIAHLEEIYNGAKSA